MAHTAFCNIQPPKLPLLNSVIFHLVVIGFVIIISLFDKAFYKEKLEVTWVELPKGTSPDLDVGIKKTETLPRSTIEEQKRLFATEAKTPEPEMKAPPKNETKLEPKPEVKPAEKVVKKAEPKKPLSASERKMRDALAKIDKEIKQRSTPAEAAQVEKVGEGYEFGTGTEPLRVPPSDPEYLQYQAKVRGKIINEWIIPPAFSELNEPIKLNSKITVMIDKDGTVISTRWEERSGNASFDASALRAVNRASPFPQPPERLAWEVFHEGFLVEFDPRLKP